jgi:hypothetical protein
MTQTDRRTRSAHISQIHPGTVIVHNGTDRRVATATPVTNGGWDLDVTFTDNGTARLTGNVTVRR